jgi:hypothetical protein
MARFEWRADMIADDADDAGKGSEGLPGERGEPGTEGGGEGGSGGRGGQGGQGGGWGVTKSGRRRLDWDLKGVLAVLSIVGALAIQTVLIASNRTDAMPPWVVGMVMAVVAFYFGTKTGNGGPS